MNARPRPATEQVELGRLTVPPLHVAALRELTHITGAPVTWHRRRALAEYVDRACTAHGIDLDALEATMADQAAEPDEAPEDAA